MKNLNRIFAIILIFALLGSCFSASAWDEPLGEAEGEAEGEIYVDDQPAPQPMEWYEDNAYVVAYAYYEDGGYMGEPLEDDCGSAQIVIDFEPDQPEGENGDHPASDPEDDWNRNSSNFPSIIGQPIVVSNDYTYGSMYWTYLRTAPGVTCVAIAYLKNGKVENARVFQADEYVYDYCAEGGYDWCLPYAYSPTGSELDHSRTVLIRASWDGGLTWGDAVESNRFVVTPIEEYAPGLTDDEYRRMIAEAEKYLGYKYKWGGSSPDTSFDCSGFVSWVINHCGNGWDVGRPTADGLKNQCIILRSADEVKPGDLIFFENTYYKEGGGATHVGICVGNGMMLHCGDPIRYESFEGKYWQDHFLCFGRLP